MYGRILMTQGDVARLMQDAVYTVLIASAPMLLAAMVVGIIISIFQATTQINEQTLAFVPKIVAVFLLLLLLWGFVAGSVEDFTKRIFEYILTMTG